MKAIVTNKCVNCKHAKVFYNGLRCDLEWRLHSLNKEACACFYKVNKLIKTLQKNGTKLYFAGKCFN